MKLFLTTICLFFFLVVSNAQNAVEVGNLRLEATYEHISVLLNIIGDDNLNSTYTIEYRQQDSNEYLMGAKTMRATASMEIDGEVIGRNYHAGSAMFLQPNTTYELRLTLTDPDGGSAVETRTWQTAAELTPAADGTIYYVAPGNGGGNGTMNDPYLGLQTAADNAAPGNIFMVTAGIYAPFTLTTDGTDLNPIVFQSQNQHQAIIDGGNTDRGIVNIGDFEQTTEEIIIDGFIIQNGAWAINAENTAFLTIKNNIIRDVDFGFYNRRESGLEHDQTIENNSFTGRTPWPTTGIPSERGIDIRGNNNVIRYNTIQYFGDGVSTDGPAYERSFSLDIHHNDIAYCGDDAIEVDFTVANTRIYRNRCYNTRTGISVAPVFGGPCYIFRNELFNQEDGFSAYKMNRSPSGLVMVHNTSNKLGYGMSSPAGWQNTYFRNNIIMGTGYVFEEYGLIANSIDDWDYNAFYSSRTGGAGAPWFKWDDIRYADVAALQAGTTIETNGVAINLNDLNNATLPANSATDVVPGTRDLTLTNGSAARNSGVVLDNINLPFVTDGQPDRGAFEAGQAYPEYGANFMMTPPPPPPNDQDAVVIGNLRLEATYEHISVLYNITNDDNRNSSLMIEYRAQGSNDYLIGAKTMRAHPSSSVDGSPLGRNHLAGSAMFLQPGTTYELRLTVTDPDGGGAVETLPWTTKSDLVPSPNGTTYYVAPGNGGGSGTMNDPYLGLQAAADNAAPGNIFMVTDGIYAPFTLTTDGTNFNPIVFQSQNQHQAIIDGGNTDRGIVNIGDFEQTTEDIIIDGFIIQNGAWAINAENTAFLTIKNNIIRDVDYGFYNRRESGLEHDQTIENNSFTGRTPWPTTGIPSERGIDIRGNNNVVRYNTIQYFGDGVSTDGPAYERSFSLDIHNNDIAYCGDDAIELDFTVANSRIYRNRCYNTRMGVSVAPVFGGPCYIFRNEFFNQEYSAYKMNRGPSGLVMVHNTSNKVGLGMSSPAGWQNTYFRNNIIMGTSYVFEEYGLVDNSVDDWDYNAFYSSRAGVVGDGNQWFKWDDVRYADLAALQAGTIIETNGIAINLNDLNNATLPADFTTDIAPGTRDLTLTNSSAARNSGAILDNINLPFVTDGQPDRGAFEVGQAYPEYGANFMTTPPPPPPPPNNQYAVVIGNLRLEATYEHISVLYDITNDDNQNSNLKIEYRAQGTSSPYLTGAKTMRAHPSSSVDGGSLGRNHLAGSAMFLQPGTTYELRLTITDPNGGGGAETINWTTKSELTPAPNGTTYYVAPGNGGGSGTMNDPYLGLQAAADNAAPGNIFMVTDGIYAPFTLTTDGTNFNPIVFQSQNQHQAIIDGGNTDRGIVNIGDFEQTTEDIIIDGFIIQNGAWAINAENTAFLTIKNNIIRDVDFGFYNRRESGLEHDQTIENNSFTGRTPWPITGIPSERGIDIRGNNNVIRYNTIQYFGDGVSTDGPAYERSFSLDIHNNDIAYCGDDAIELDFTVANSRVYRNRCYNTRMGVSVAPVFGGPCYIFRNEFFNQEYSAYKMNRGPSGLVMVHNTSNKVGLGMSSPAGWQNTYFRNNIIMGTSYVFEEYGLVDNSVDDWDYNAFYSSRAGVVGDGNQWFKWDDVRYADLAALQAGTTIETNGIALTLNDLNNATLPADFTTDVAPGTRDLTLANGSAARNSGAILDNINLPFVTDGQPDRGAFEAGEAYPEYGANFMMSTSADYIIREATAITIYPNPARDQLYLASTLVEKIEAIHIRSISGQLVESPIVNTALVIPISNLVAGIYILEIKTKEGRYYKKFLKE